MRMRGEGDREGAQRILSNCFFDACRPVRSADRAGACLEERLLMWFGASALTFPYANDYITIHLLGNSLCPDVFRIESIYRLPGICKRRDALVLGAVSTLFLIRFLFSAWIWG